MSGEALYVFSVLLVSHRFFLCMLTVFISLKLEQLKAKNELRLVKDLLISRLHVSNLKLKTLTGV